MENLFNLFSSIGTLVWETKETVLMLFRDAFDENAEFAIKILFHMIDSDQRINEEDVFFTILEGVLLDPYYPSSMKIHLLETTAAYNKWYLMWPLLGDAEKNLTKELMEIAKKQFDEDLRRMSEGRSISNFSRSLPPYYSKIPAKRSQANIIKCGLRLKDGEEYDSIRKKMDRYYKNYSPNRDQKDHSNSLKAAFSSCMDLYYYVAPNKIERRVKTLAQIQGKVEVCHTHPYQLFKTVGLRPKNSVGADLTLDNYNKDFKENWDQIVNNSTYMGETLVAIDTSSSMFGSSLEMAVSNALYFSQINKGAYKNKYIKNDWVPSIETFPRGSIKDKVQSIEVIQTSVSPTAIMKSVLKYSIDIGEAPDRVIVISDRDFYDDVVEISGRRTMKEIKSGFEGEGLKTPSLVYINTRSTNQNPDLVYINGIQTIILGRKSLKTFNTIISSAQRSEEDIMMHMLSKPKYANIGKFST